MIPNSKKCSVCNSPNIMKAKRDEDGDIWYYCSEECFQTKTPPIKRLEKIFSKDIETILVDAIKNFESSDARLDFLGITDPTLRTWVKKFFGMNMHQFFIHCGKKKSE